MSVRRRATPRHAHARRRRTIALPLGLRWLVGLAAVVVLILVSVETPPTGAPSAGVGHPCTSAQLRETLGANHRLAGGRVQESLLTVINTGATCTLVSAAPLFTPVVGPRERAVGAGDVAAVSGSGSVRLRVTRGGRVTSYLLVETLPRPWSKSCHPTTSTGVTLGLGTPTGSRRYVAHGLVGVCANPRRPNVGATRYAPA